MTPYKKIFEDFNSDQLVFIKPSKELEQILKTSGIEFRREEHQGKFYYSFDSKKYPEVQEIMKKNGIKPDKVQRALFSSFEDEHFTKKGYYSEDSEKIQKKILDRISKMKRHQKENFDISDLQGEDLQKFLAKISSMGHTYTSGDSLAFQKK